MTDTLPKVFVFDLDGTLIKHNDAYRWACVHSVATQSFKPYWMVRARFGKYSLLPETLQTVYNKGLHGNIVEDQPQSLIDLFNKARTKMPLDYIKPAPSTADALSRAQDLGILLHVLTRSDPTTAAQSLERAGLDSFFPGTVHSVYNKRTPSAYRDFLRATLRNKYSSDEVVLFDDTKPCIDAASQAGWETVHINNNIHPLEDIVNAIVDEVIAHTSELSHPQDNSGSSHEDASPT